MLELPEAAVIAEQLNNVTTGKRIKEVIVAHTPHKFAWYVNDRGSYPDLLIGKLIDNAAGYGGWWKSRSMMREWCSVMA
jgi:formamidopyrimidine-DNA glycosylase